MPIIANPHTMPARRKMPWKALAERIGMAEHSVSL
jgi:DNA-binding Xre family transcriptional regulator